MFANDEALTIIGGGENPPESGRLRERVLHDFSKAIASKHPASGADADFHYAGTSWRWMRFTCSCGSPTPEHLNALMTAATPGEHLPYDTALAAMFRLSARETQALGLFIKGFGAKEVAAHMGISPSTAKSFLRLITIKMGVSGRSELMSKLLNFTRGASFDCPFRRSLSPPASTNPHD